MTTRLRCASALFAGVLAVGYASLVPTQPAMANECIGDPSSGNLLGSTINANTGCVRPVQVPRDDAPHAGDALDCWQWWPHLQTSDGRHFGAMLVFCSMLPTGPNDLSPQSQAAWSSTVRVTDLDTGVSKTTQSTAQNVRPHPSRNGFTLANGSQWARGGNGHDTLHLQLGGDTLDLHVDQTRPIVPYFNSSGTAVGAGQAVRIYQRQAMNAQGTITVDGRPAKVTGTATFERLMADMLEFSLVGQDFMTLELADGRTVLLARGFAGSDRNSPTIKWMGWVQKPDGTIDYLDHANGDFDLRPTRMWQRDSTCAYPAAWDVRIGTQHFTVAPVTMQPGGSTTPDVWDGDVRVTGSVTGWGAAEYIFTCPPASGH